MIKYLHILYHDDIKFNRNLFNTLNNKSFGFEPDEHYFITPHNRVYDELSKEYNNIKYEETRYNKLINLYGRKAEWIFVHALNIHINDLLWIPRRVCKKIIWRTWGHDIPNFPGITDNIIITLMRLIRNRICKWKIQSFYGIGMGFKYDKILLEKKIGKIKRTFLLPYTQADINLLERLKQKSKKHESLRIMIGHSGYTHMEHEEILDKLVKFRKENITICLVLSYGDFEYIKRVKQYANSLFPKEKIEIIEDFMPIERYIEYLSSIDIGIFAMQGSAALANMTNLIHMHKKLYVKEDGLMDEAMDCEKIEHGHIEDIKNITFEEFSKPISTIKEADEFTKNKTDRNYMVNMWKKILDELSDL